MTSNCEVIGDNLFYSSGERLMVKATQKLDLSRPAIFGIIAVGFKVQMKCFFLFPNLKEQQKSGRSPFTVS